MSVAILEDIVKKTVSKTEKTEKYSAKLTPDAPPFFTCANVTKNEDIFELMKAVWRANKAARNYPKLKVSNGKGFRMIYNFLVNLLEWQERIVEMLLIHQKSHIG